MSASATARAAAAAPQPPVEFTGHISCGPPVSDEREGTHETVEVGDSGMVVSRFRDGAWRQSMTMTDARLEGAIHHTYEMDSYSMPGAETDAEVFAATWRIENDEGAWESRSLGARYADGTTIGGDDPVEVLVGEGAYEGLVAIMDVISANDCVVEVRGIIFDGAPAPEPYVAA